MNVLLVSPLIQECNYTGDYFSQWPQLGIGYLAAVLERAQHTVKFIERKLIAGPVYPAGSKMNKVDALFLQQVKDFHPDIVGLTATTPVIMDAYHTAKIIKRVMPKVRIIIGGRHATSLPESTLSECPQIDMVCIGEGEFTLLDLANGKPIDKVRGIVYRKDGNIIRNPMRALCDNLDEIPPPAWHLLDQDFYFQENISIMRGDYMRTATIMTSRGCPYRCAFCQSPELLDIYGKRYIRYHSVDRAISEIEYLMNKFKIKGISFNDDMFSLNRERVLQICKAIIARNINKNLKFTVNLRSDRVDEGMLSALKEAGCIHVIFGSESGSEATLKRMNKSLSVAKNIEAIKLTKQYGLTAEANIVIGSPKESKNDFLQTIKFLKISRPDRIFVSKFYPLPGTQFYQQLLEEKIIPRPKNWNQINDLYVENDNFTFADIKPDKFVALRNKMAREVVARTNFFYVIKANFARRPLLAISQMTKLFLYLTFLCLPLSGQKMLKKAIAKLNSKIRYLLRK